MPIRLPLTCPILVGRDHELALYDRLLDEAHHRGVTTTIIGEAGAGKSRLVRDVVMRATSHGFQILSGGSTQHDRHFPFGPFVDALRQRLMLPDTHPRDLFGSHGEWLVDLLPELQSVYPDHDVPLNLTPEQGKRQRFEAIASVLARIAAQRPLVVVLEDIHWADPTSLELLELLPRRLAASPVLLITTTRPDEMNDRLHAVLATWRRSQLLIEITLDPLSHDAVRQMVDAMLPATPASPVIQVVLARAGGNPFFVEEILATIVPTRGEWVAGEIPVPRTVRDSVLHRIEGLSCEAQTVIRMLAVAGQQVNLHLLGSALGIDDDTVIGILRLLHDRGILVDAPSAQRHVIAFKHALTRDAILDALPLVERRPLHEQIAVALERMAGTDGSIVVSEGDLGYHFYIARGWDKALHYARAAGDIAWELHATFEALGHYRRALDAALMLGSPEAAPLHCRCGQALDLLGGFEAARDHFEEAVRLAQASGDSATEQTALYEAAGLYTSRDYQRARELADAALAVARTMGDRRREGLALNRLGNVLTNLEQFAAGRALHEEALALFEALDDRWGAADSHDLIGSTDYLRGEVPAARAALGRAADMFAELRTPLRVASARTIQGMYLAVLDGPCASDAPPQAFRRDALQGLEVSRSIEWRAGEAFALVSLACADIGESAYQDAASRLDTALAITREIGHSQWTVIARISYGILFADIFNDQRALAEFEQAHAIAHEMGFAQWETRLQVWIARCHTRLGDQQRAESLLTPLLPTNPPGSIRERRALTTYTELALLRNCPEDALTSVDRLLEAHGDPPSAATLLLRARILNALDRPDDAERAFRFAGHLAGAYGPRSVGWQAPAGIALLTGSSDHAHLARKEIESISAALPEDWREVFLLAPEVRPWVKHDLAAKREKAGPFDLTRREREVATLVAQGLTNKQIASQLSVAEKTVEMHVSNCLGKLGCATRAQLAARAVTKGLVNPTPPQG